MPRADAIKFLKKVTSKQFEVAFVFTGLLLHGATAPAQHMEASKLTTPTAVTKPLPAYLLAKDAAIPDEVRQLERSGALSEAIGQLESLTSASTDSANQKALRRESFRLQALKREFSIPADQMLQKIQGKIPGATSADLHRWTADNSLSWIPIDGEVRYFRREPGILLRVNKDAKARADAQAGSDPAGEGEGSISFTGHMKSALTAARDTGSSVVLPVRYEVEHTVTVKPGKVPAGETIRCWMPFPRQDVPQQSDVVLLSMEPKGTLAADESSRQRTVYIEQPAGPDGSATFRLKFEYTCAAFVPDLTKAAPALSANERQKLQSYLQPRPPHVAITDDITSLARSIIGDNVAVTDKAREIWRWLDKTIPWCPEMDYAVRIHIVDKVLTERRGDCGTQALAFIALCRAVDVPARWQSGWVMRPGRWNLHDWAEFYAPNIGWVPADPSIGSQEHEDPAVREFLFGHTDAYRMIANSDFAAEFSPTKTHHRSDPIDNQRGEVEWAGENLYYDEWDYKVQAQPVHGK